MRDKSPVEVLLAFLKLGLTAFGGPVAHIGYFREEMVVRRRWVDDAAYAELVALSQFLPGPASSQVGFSLGLIRAGYWGGLAAWLGFTLPSALFMTLVAFGASSFGGPVGAGLLHGLKLVAVAVVAQAVWSMARTLCPDPQRAAIGCIAAGFVLSTDSRLSQLTVIVFGASMGLWLCRGPSQKPVGVLGAPVSRPAGLAALAAFLVLAMGLPLLRTVRSIPGVAIANAFYRSGALVFGGGHVVLPLLHDAVVTPGWVSDDAFLAGYGAAQAVPGPLFTFAAYLGAEASSPSHRVLGAAIALVAIFLPGMLLLIGTLSFWDGLRSKTEAQAIVRGINAAVVGLLGAALYSPVWSSAVFTAPDAGIAVVGFLLLTGRAPPIVVVLLGAAAGIALSRPAN